MTKPMRAIWKGDGAINYTGASRTNAKCCIRAVSVLRRTSLNSCVQSLPKTPMYYAKELQNSKPLSFVNINWDIQGRASPIPNPSSSKIIGFISTASQAIPKSPLVLSPETSCYYLTCIHYKLRDNLHIVSDTRLFQP